MCRGQKEDVNNNESVSKKEKDRPGCPDVYYLVKAQKRDLETPA